MNNPWNEVTITALKLLWAEGHSASEIGRRLHMSRNAVMGKIHRLSVGEPLPKGRPKNNYVPRVSQVSGRTRAGNAGALAKKIAEGLFGYPTKSRPRPRVVPKAIPTAPEGAPVTLMNLEPHHCRFIADAPAGPNTVFCGGNKKPGHSYCAFHAEYVQGKAGTPWTDERLAQFYRGRARNAA